MDMPGESVDDLDPALVDAWRALAGASLDIRARWFQVAEQLGLTPAGLDALLKVDREEPPSMRDLAHRLGCDASFVTAMVDDLEAAGYAERRPAATDRRVKKITLTPAGRQAQRLAQQQLTRPPPALQSLSPAEQRNLARLLSRALNAR